MTDGTQNFQHLLGCGEVVAHLAVVPDIDQKIRLKRVYRFVASSACTLFEAVDDAGLNRFVFSVWWRYRVQTQWRLLQLVAVEFDVAGQLHAKVVQGEFVQGDGFVEVFQIQHLVLQAQELLVAITCSWGEVASSWTPRRRSKLPAILI